MRQRVHSASVRLTHWVNALAMPLMILSGWQIYNASPLFPFRFPSWAALGGWLGAGIAWHLAAMWLLVLNGVFAIAYGLISGHYRRDFLPIRPGGVLRDLWLSLTFRLQHTPGRYNFVQRLLYVGVLLCGMLSVISGVALWKPVQFWWLDQAVGGYPVVRFLHFFAMSGIVAFLIVHLVLAVLIPSTIWSMITGRARVS